MYGTYSNERLSVYMFVEMNLGFSVIRMNKILSFVWFKQGKLSIRYMSVFLLLLCLSKIGQIETRVYVRI